MSNYRIITAFLKKYSLFLIVLPVFFIYNGYNQLFGFLPFAVVFFNFLCILCGVVLFYFLFRFLLKKAEKAAIFTFLLTVLMLGFGYLHDSMKSYMTGSFIIKYKVLLPVLVILVFILYFWIKTRKTSITEAFLYLNTLMILVTVSEIPNSIYKYRINKKVHNLIDYSFTAYNQYRPASSLSDSAKPDIYFLVFDEMSSTKALKTAWNIDNSLLDSFLIQKGFYIAPDAKSNYSWTVHSISTTFNMTYLPDTLTPVLNDPKSYFWATNSILKNSLTSVLNREGYHIFQYQPLSFDNKDWPEEPNFHRYRKFHFFYKTLPGRMYRDLFWNLSKTRINNLLQRLQLKFIEERNNKKDRLLKYTIEKVKASVSLNSKPKFVYGHFMVPHDPFIYDSSGILQSPEKSVISGRKEILTQYKNQLVYANRILKDVVAHILQNNKKNTVIIVEGDHGFRYYTKPGQEFMYQNMNAVYFPDKDYRTLYDSLSPVNTFRIVLNKYFKAGYPMLIDRRVYIPEQNPNQVVR